jgi:hypothetical protein
MTFIERKPGRSPRGSPFVAGNWYRVLSPAPSYPWGNNLSTDELLKYFGASYSHYDSMTVYVFTNAAGQERTWILYDEEPLDEWRTHFAAALNGG